MGKQWKQCQTLFFGAPKSLQMVIGMWEYRRGNLHPQWDPLSKAGAGLGLVEVTESLLKRMPPLEDLLQCRFQGYIATKCRAWWLSWWLWILQAERWLWTLENCLESQDVLAVSAEMISMGTQVPLLLSRSYQTAATPHSKPWGNSGKKNTCFLAAIKVQIPPTVSPKETGEGKQYVLSISHQTAASSHGEPWRN